MTYLVTPTEERPTHHVLLTDSTGGQAGLILCKTDGTPDPFAWTYGPLPATGVKTYQGTQGYSDTPPPWTPEVQSDWSGGRGSKDFDKDTTKYADNYRVNTTRTGEIIPGPWDNWATGINNWVGYWEGIKANVSARAGLSINVPILKLADSFVATQNCAFIWFVVGYVGSPTALTVNIYADSSGPTGAAIGTTSLATTSLKNGGNYEVVRVALTATLTPATTYWVSFEASGTTGNYWLIGIAEDTNQSCKTNTGSWVAYNQAAPYHRICGAEDPFQAHFVNFKGNVIAALEYDDGGSSKLFINGAQGAATGGSTTTLADTAQDWTDGQWEGSLVTFNEGSGSGQPNNWALVTDTTSTTDVLTFAAVDVAPAAQTLYSIVGTPKWYEINSTGTDVNWSSSTGGVVVDALSVNHGIIFAKGDDRILNKYLAYNSSGTWTQALVPGSTGATFGGYSFLEDATDQDGAYIWGGKGGYPSKINYASSVDWSGTSPSTAPDLVFTSTGINTGDLGERITSMLKYGEYGNLHVLKEGSIYQIVDKQPYQLGLAQYGNSRDRRNGVASVAHNVYMYSSYHNTIMRYFNGQMDNVGPTRDEEGLPANRLGSPVNMVGYENLVIAAFDGGDSNYSSIIAYNGLGLCELYRPPAVGLRIRNLHIESLPGDNVDRLWFDCGSDIGWLTLASDPFNFPINNNYHHYSFAMDGNIILSYMYFNQQDINKLFNSIRVLAEKSEVSKYVVYIDYRLDETTTWTRLGTIDSFRDELTISSAYSVVGRRIQFRLTPYSVYTEYIPRITATIAEALIQQNFKYYLELTFRIADKDDTLRKIPDDRATFASKWDYLMALTQSPAGALMRTQYTTTDNKYYKMDPMSMKIINHVTREGRNFAVARARFYQLS